MGKKEDQNSRRSKKHKRRKISNEDNEKIVATGHEITLEASLSQGEEVVDVVVDKVQAEISCNVEQEATNKEETKNIKPTDDDNNISDLAVSEQSYQKSDLPPSTSNNIPAAASKPITLETTANTTPTKTAKNQQTTTPTTAAAVATTTTPPNAAKKSKKRRSSGTSSDEERWLTAIESGKLDDVDDELKKIKDPKLMTARQRAIYDRTQDKDSIPGTELLISLPNGYREKEKPQTAEEIQKAVLKSQKRKQQADERREKDKKKTMERLLKKQDSSKQRGAAARNKLLKPVVPMIRYTNTHDGATVSMPPGYEFPLSPQKSREPPKQQLCGIKGCSQPKVYSCTQTKIPLCSIKCYRKNLSFVH